MNSNKVNARMEIVAFEERYKPYFKSLNEQWLKELFSVEPYDEYVLNNPEEAILSKGGKILFAIVEGEVVGTVGLKITPENDCEITKMAVDPKYRGKGYGKDICAAAIEEAKKMECNDIMLYTSSILKNAIHIYEQLGFKHVSFEKGIYARGDVKMVYER